ncbi:MAG: thiamine pyrophosphate-dependent dehydrogenase E1 component subunit alpha [Planctomycetota bacterium]|jgi:2-oxoisovalerate dehydrogenase E1 component alpha subunit|nr:thiamine pyrophosphate-dependent dehydrogenase E1 component subunit alpha [Planctomycetota bacterium]
MSELLQILDETGKKVGKAPRVKREVLLQIYRAIVQTRAFDDRCMKLQRTGRIGFSVPNLGIEAVSAGAAAAMDPIRDWFAPYYRDFAMLFYHDVSAEKMFDNMFGNCEDNAVGRQMPVHFTFTEPAKFFSISSPLGTQIPQAVGMAMAMKNRGEDSAVITTFGDGTTSSSGFHSGLNFAGVYKAPIVFLCQNNQFAISCHSDMQTASESYAIKARAYGMPGVRVDGNDALAVYKAVSDAAKRAREGKGPTLIEAYTFRMGGHSTSDDPSRYVDAGLIAKWQKRDPLLRLRNWLIGEGHLTEERADEIANEVAEEIKQAADAAQAKSRPVLGTIFTDVFEKMPSHLEAQMEGCIKHHAERDEAVDEKGEFPL